MRRFQHLLVSLAFLIVLLVPSAVPDRAAQFSAEPKDSTAIVAAWNLKGFTPIPTARARAIAQGIYWLDPEIVAVSEVNPVSTAQTIVDQLATLGVTYHHSTPDQSQASQDIGLLWKDGVTVANIRQIAGSDLGRTGYRNAIAADVKIGNFDFLLIAVHLKAGRANSSRDRRTEQCAIIDDFVLANTQGVEKDVVILGDYNMIPAQGTSQNDAANFDAMNPNGFLEFVSTAELKAGTHISGGSLGNLLDGFAISDEFTEEYIAGSLRAFPLQKTWRQSLSWFSQNVSDHVPLVARFVVNDPDDDQ